MNRKLKRNPLLQPLALGLLLLGAGAASAETGSGSATAGLDTRDYTLAVASAHGTPVPAVGTNTYAWHSNVTCSVNSAVSEGGTNYTCTGWTGTGAVPATGTTNNTGAIMLTNVASSIAWQWQAAAVPPAVNVVRVGTCPPYNSQAAQTVAVAGNYAYVANSGAGLLVVDVSSPTNPVMVGRYDTSGWALGVAVAGRYAYVGDGNAGLQVIDVANPAIPVRVGGYYTAGVGFFGVAVAGNYAYVADGSSGQSGLHVIDVSNPANPVQVGVCHTPGGAIGVAVAGNYAYVADQLAGLQIIDVSNPASPVRVGGYDTSGLAQIVVVSGRYAYVADTQSGWQVIDVIVPSNPTLAGGYPFGSGGNAEGVAVSGRYAYGVGGAGTAATSGLRVFDVSNPTNLVPVGGFTYSGASFLDVSVVGNYAYVAANTEGLIVLRIDAPQTAPTIAVQPQSQTVTASSNAFFSVTATGTAPLTYQWRKGGTNLVDAGRVSGSTSNVLALSTTDLTDAANYDVIVGNAYGSVTSQVAVLTVTMTSRPDLSLSSTDFRILNAAGVETWSLAVGEPATLAVTVRNTGATNTAGNVLVQVFLDGSPTNLVAYDAALYTNVATATLSNAIPAGGSVTLTLPWTVTGPDRQLTLAVVAEFVSNRAQAQSNSQTTNPVALPVGEVSFANNSVARSLQVGTPAPNNYGIIVQAVWPADLRTGRRYELTGTAAYNWGGQQPVLGADVTVSVNNIVYLTRTLIDGTWRITLDPLPLGANQALAQVFDGGGTTGSTNFTLLVTTGTPVVDLRIIEVRFEGGGVYRYSGEAAWCTNLSAVTVRARVRNDGNTNCSPFQVSFQAGAAAAQTAAVAALAPGTEAWVTNASAWTAAPQGDVSFTVAADSAGAVGEADESNNTRSATVHVRQAKPDLVVSGISASPSTPKAGDTVTITATILNQGAVPVAAGSNFQTGFSLGGTNLVTLAASLPPGGSVVATTTWTAQAGTYALRATADSSGVIPEDYEDNNDLTVTLAVRQALPNLAPWYLQYGYYTISGLSFSPAQPVVGDLVTMTCDVYNYGTVAVPQGTNFNVAFSVNDVPAGTVPVTLSASLPVGGKTSATLIWSSVGQLAGPVTVKALADSGNAVAEESEADNLTATTLQLCSPASSLVVASLAPSVWQPLPGALLSLTATIRNDGGADAPAGGLVTFYTNAVAPGNAIGSSLLSGPVAAKGGTRTVAVAWRAPGTPQAVTLYAVLGTSQSQCTVTVVAVPAPDLAVYSDFITINPPMPNAGQVVTVSATVTNLAGSTASNVVVQFLVYLPDRGWVQLGEACNAGALAVGAATNVTARDSIVADWPSYVVQVSVAAAQSDQNPNDNAATTSFVLADTPVAEAGTNQTGFVGQTITLNGSASRNATTYAWRIAGRPTGSVAGLTNAATATPVFVPDMAGVFTFELIVHNGPIASVADMVSVTVSGQPPTITTGPSSQTLVVGSTAVFSVTASSTLPLSYQWYFNTSTALAGATNATLIRSNVQLADAGSYSVVVTNAAGAVSSTGAVLTVFLPVPPTIGTQPVSRGAAPGDTVTFTATASGTPPFSYQWQFNGTNIPGATGATLTLAGVGPAAAGGYQVVVINAAGTNVSREVSLNFISLQMYAGLTISGRVGGTNRIEASLLETNGPWTQLTTLALPASPYLWIDPDSAALPRRFYRAIPVD